MPAARRPQHRRGVGSTVRHTVFKALETLKANALQQRRTSPVVDLTRNSLEQSESPNHMILALAARQSSEHQGQHPEPPTYSNSQGPPQCVTILLEQALLLTRETESYNTAVQRDMGALEREHIELKESYDRTTQVYSESKTRWAMQETMYHEALTRQGRQIGMLEASAHIGEEWRSQLLQRDKTVERLRKSIASRVLSIESNYCNGCGNDIDTSDLATNELYLLVQCSAPRCNECHRTKPRSCPHHSPHTAQESRRIYSLTCQVCQKPDQLHHLSCGHTHCSSCQESIITVAAGDKDYIKCSICRQQIRLSQLPPILTDHNV